MSFRSRTGRARNRRPASPEWSQHVKQKRGTSGSPRSCMSFRARPRPSEEPPARSPGMVATREAGEVDVRESSVISRVSFRAARGRFLALRPRLGARNDTCSLHVIPSEARPSEEPPAGLPEIPAPREARQAHQRGSLPSSPRDFPCRSRTVPCMSFRARPRPSEEPSARSPGMVTTREAGEVDVRESSVISRVIFRVARGRFLAPRPRLGARNDIIGRGHKRSIDQR